MKKYGLRLNKAAIVCFGIAAIAGCCSAGTTGQAYSARIEPQPSLALAEQPRSATLTHSGTYANVPEAPTIAPAPESPTSALAPEMPASAPTPETPTSTPTVVMNHALDYTWLKGTLVFTHADSGHWKVRYALLSEEDPFGGSVVLDTDVRLEKYQDGDTVYVEGELVRSQPSLYVSGPLYRVHSLRLISRGN